MNCSTGWKVCDIDVPWVRTVHARIVRVFHLGTVRLSRQSDAARSTLGKHHAAGRDVVLPPQFSANVIARGAPTLRPERFFTSFRMTISVGRQ